MVQTQNTHVRNVLGNPDHVELVKRGSGAIKRWRKCHPTTQLDLRGANLEGIDLRRADLSEADCGMATPNEMRMILADAKLSGVSLRGAFMRAVDFSGADLRKADLSNAQLSIGDFSHADLREANLTNSIMIATDFHRARFDSGDVTGSIIGHTRFTATDLSDVSGLDTLRHDYPSVIDVETLFASAGSLPTSFLEGIGVPNVLSTHLRSLVGAMEPLQFQSCFISFSHCDDAFAKRLYSRLHEARVPVWFAPEDIQGGRKLYEQLDEAIQVHDRLLLVLSEHSMHSQWVITELRRALTKKTAERNLFPIRLCGMKSLQEWVCFDADSGRDLAIQVREYFIPDFSGWKNHDEFETAFNRLLQDLEESA